MSSGNSPLSRRRPSVLGSGVALEATRLATQNDLQMESDSGSDLFLAETDRAFYAAVVLIDRARAAGVIRPDFDHSDLALLTRANSGLSNTTHRSAPQAWRRLTDHMLQAFGEAGPEPLTAPSPAWTAAPTVVNRKS